jgi:FlaA1/EpsC-like NDP-sugar epimerase
LIRLSGLQVLDDNNPDGDIEIKYTGIRPGEKLYEELLVGDNVTETENELIMRAQEEMIDWVNLKPLLDELNKAAKHTELARIRELLIQIVPEFRPNSHVLD